MLRNAGRRRAWLSLTMVALCGTGCGDSRPDPMTVAESFIDAFYAFDGRRLAALMVAGPDADGALYYQGWAEAAHYRIQERHPCHTLEDGRVVCAVTVTDDFGQTLGYTATDTFTLSIGDGVVTGVAFVGDDPPVFEELFKWLATTRPEVFSGPCRDMFDGGTTPGACARAIAQGARDFAARPID